MGLGGACRLGDRVVLESDGSAGEVTLAFGLGRLVGGFARVMLLYRFGDVSLIHCLII